MRISPKLWCLLGVHEDEVIRSGPLNIHGLPGEVVETRQYYDLRCKVCGRVRMKKL